MNWKFLRPIVGAILMLIGFAALVTPLTPGSWLIFIGAEMLGIGFLSRERLKGYYEKVREWWNEHRENWPRER